MSRATRASQRVMEQENQRKAELQQLITEGIKEAIPQIIATYKEKGKAHMGGSHTTHHGSNGDNQNEETHPLPKKAKTDKGCSYRTFQACKPQEFAGNEGAVAALRWLEKMESVLAVSKCLEEDKILFATNSFKD